MANLKSLKTRIKSVKSTQKMTKAMKMVAASRLRKARTAVESSRPYINKISEMLNDIAGNIILEGSESEFPLLTGNKESKIYLLIVLSSDRGLCGGLNGSTAKLVKSRISKLKSENKDIKVLFVGKKAYELLKTTHKEHIIKTINGAFRSAVQFNQAQEIANEVIQMFKEGQFDVCEIIYSEFKSAINQEQKYQQLIPLEIDLNKKVEDKEEDFSPISYEPNQEVILNELLPKNIAIQIYSRMLENFASEQGARMSAMESATNNAGKMIKNLTLVYNRTRQANITKELIDIISGANSV